MTQLIDDVLKMDEEERLRQEATCVRGILFARSPGTRVADMQRRIRDAMATWLDARDLDAAEFAMLATAATTMTATASDSAECNAP